MQQENNNDNLSNEKNAPTSTSEKTNMQEKSDPQLTELKGFIDPKEDIEPTLQDGTKAPDKPAPEESK